MFDLGRNQVPANCFLHFRHAKNYRIVAFRTAGGKNNLLVFGIDCLGDGVPGRFHAVAGLPAQGVGAGCIAEVIGHFIRDHVNDGR